ncbi:Ig-like domain-containing protein, partial [bacterium]|nr:Ig-like domain-containing protein [bacterium]
NNFVVNAAADIGQVYYKNAKVTIVVSDGINESDRLYSPSEPLFDIDTLPPAGITRFRERGHDSSHVQLQWNLSDNNTSISVSEDNFLKYVVYYGTSPGVSEQLPYTEWGPVEQTAMGLIDTRIANVGGEGILFPGTRYYFRLYVYDSFGNQCLTGEVSVITGEGASSLMKSAPAQSSDGDGLVSARIFCRHPDDFDSFINVCYSTSGSGAGASWHSASLSTETAAFYFDGAFHPLTPPEVDNEQYFQIGTALHPVITSSGTETVIDVKWNSAEDLPGVSYGSVFLRTIVRDIYAIEQLAPAISDAFSVDNVKPVPESAQYIHGAESYGLTSGNLAVFCNTSSDFILYNQIFISTMSDFSAAYSSFSALCLDEAEYDAASSSSTLYFHLSNEKWKQIALWGRNADHLYIHFSSGALKDGAGNASDQTSMEAVWFKDNNPPVIDSAFYAQNESNPAKLSGLRIQFSDEISGWAGNIGSLLSVYTSTSVPETPVIFDDGVVISSVSANIFWFYPSEEKHIEILNLGVTELYLAFGSIGYDYSGNWLQDITQANAIRTHLTRETSAPWVMDYSPDASVKANPENTDIWIRFNESLYSDSVTDANVHLTKIRNLEGEHISEGVPVFINYVSSACLITVSPYSLLEYGCAYRLTASTAICDMSLNHMLYEFSLEFETLFNLASGFTISTGAASIVVYPNALTGSGRVELILDGFNATVNAAFLRESALGDVSHRQMAEGVVTIDIYDEFDNIISSSFANTVTLSFSYEDDDGNGFVDGLSPPVRVDSLAIYWLSDTTAWIRLPNSTLVKSQKKVSADIRHFSSYALMGGALYGIEDAHPYPVPYRKSEDIGNGIIFTFPSGSDAEIKIYDILGRLLKEFSYIDATADVPGLFTGWTDIKLPSGVYIYRIKSGENEKRGKLVIIQ